MELDYACLRSLSAVVECAGAASASAAAILRLLTSAVKTGKKHVVPNADIPVSDVLRCDTKEIYRMQKDDVVRRAKSPTMQKYPERVSMSTTASSPSSSMMPHCLGKVPHMPFSLNASSSSLGESSCDGLNRENTSLHRVFHQHEDLNLWMQIERGAEDDLMVNAHPSDKSSVTSSNSWFQDLSSNSAGYTDVRFSDDEDDSTVASNVVFGDDILSELHLSKIGSTPERAKAKVHRNIPTAMWLSSPEHAPGSGSSSISQSPNDRSESYRRWTTPVLHHKDFNSMVARGEPGKSQSAPPSARVHSGERIDESMRELIQSPLTDDGVVGGLEDFDGHLISHRSLRLPSHKKCRYRRFLYNTSGGRINGKSQSLESTLQTGVKTHSERTGNFFSDNTPQSVSSESPAHKNLLRFSRNDRKLSPRFIDNIFTPQPQMMSESRIFTYFPNSTSWLNHMSHDAIRGKGLQDAVGCASIQNSPQNVKPLIGRLLMRPESLQAIRFEFRAKKWPMHIFRLLPDLKMFKKLRTKPRKVRETGLELLAGGCMKPHSLKGRCEDSFFVSKSRRGLGVADGVSAWRQYNINSRQFADQLMYNSRKIIDEDDECQRQCADSSEATFNKARETLLHAFNNVTAYGGSTAILAVMDSVGMKLEVANLGDSTICVLRRDLSHGMMKVVFRSRELQHSFNQPFQLMRLPKPEDVPLLQSCGMERLAQAVLSVEIEKGVWDTPVNAECYKVPLREGDLIVVGSDGLFDNLFESEICAVASLAISPLEAACRVPAPGVAGGMMDATNCTHPRDIARALSHCAFHRSLDDYADTPFVENAEKSGFLQKNENTKGGKQDDITVAVAWVV